MVRIKMAIYNLNIKNGSPNTGGSHAMYIARDGKYGRDEKDKELVYSEMGNMPNWAQDNYQTFWKRADEYERVNGRPYREIVVALPKELTQEKNREIVDEFVKKELGNNHPYFYTIHKNVREELHCHLMFTERKLDGINRKPEYFFMRGNSKNPEKGGAKKDREWHKISKVYEVRKDWEQTVNKHLLSNNINEKIDCRSLAEQRKEALKNSDIKKAEVLDRNGLNIEGKILQKIDRNGLENLSEFHLRKYESFLQDKRVKTKKEQNYKKTLGHENVTSTQKEIVDKIEKRSEKTINILSDGKYFKLKKNIEKTEKFLLSNDTKYMQNKLEQLKNYIENLTKKITNTNEYKTIINKIKNEYSATNNNSTNKLKNENSIDFKTTNKIEYRLEKKYSKMDQLHLSLEISKIEEKLNNKELIRAETKNDLTDYELSGTLAVIERMQKEIEKLKKRDDPDKEEKINSYEIYMKDEYKHYKDAVYTIEDSKDELESKIEHKEDQLKFELAIAKSYEAGIKPESKVDLKNYMELEVEKTQFIQQVNWLTINREDESKRRDYNKILYLKENSIVHIEQHQNVLAERLKKYNSEDIEKSRIELLDEYKNENQTIKTKLENVSWEPKEKKMLEKRFDQTTKIIKILSPECVNDIRNDFKNRNNVITISRRRSIEKLLNNARETGNIDNIKFQLDENSHQRKR